jgi:hypothetical protein
MLTILKYSNGLSSSEVDHDLYSFGGVQDAELRKDIMASIINNKKVVTFEAGPEFSKSKKKLYTFHYNNELL